MAKQQTTTDNRTIIKVDRKAYEIEQINYNKKVQLEDAILKEIYSLLPDVKINETNLFNDVLSEFNTLVELVYKDTNPMRLKGSKLMELLEIDASNLVVVSTEYDKVKHLTQPNIDDFYTFIDDDAEYKRYILCKKVANLLNEVSTEHQIYGLQITQGFNHLVNFNMENQEYFVNVPFIKSTRY